VSLVKLALEVFGVLRVHQVSKASEAGQDATENGGHQDHQAPKESQVPKACLVYPVKRENEASRELRESREPQVQLA
jgi:hypothetical protein